MVKTLIDIKVRAKAKNVEVEEYEKIMNIWRACMLFFERELRKLNDKGEIATTTLRKMSDNLDFTDLLRLSFLSIKDNERMKLVKLSEVAEAIQRVHNVSKIQPLQQEMVDSVTENQNYPQNQFYEQSSTENAQEYHIQAEQQGAFASPFGDQNNNPIRDILSKKHIEESPKPEIHAKDHINVLQRNTASAVIELRKMMYENIQKLRQTLAEEA